MPLTIEIELKNYRCFEDSAPARFTLRPGFTALIGKNNAGKSTLLRSLFEFRPLFRQLQKTNDLLNALRAAQTTTFQLPPNLSNSQPLFYDRNERPLEIGLVARAVEVG